MDNHTKTYLMPVLAMLGLLLAILWMAGGFDDKIQPGRLSSGKVYQGETLTLQTSAVQSVEEVAASVHSKQTTQVASRVLAPIKKIHVKAGDIVHQGDLLIELDNRNNLARVGQSQGNLNAIRAQLKQADSHYQRTQNLYSKESVTKAELERARAAYNSLRAQLAGAVQKLESSRTTSSYSQIKATFTAKVIDRFAEPGDIASPGVKLLTLYDPQSLRVDANVRESVALSLKIGDQLEAVIPALNTRMPVIVEEIVPEANPGARSFLIKAKIEHQGRMLPGMFARIRIPLAEQQQLLIPQRYVKQMGQLDVVWVLEQKQAVRRFIRTGAVKQNDQVLVISGLDAGEQLILPEHVGEQR